MLLLTVKLKLWMHYMNTYWIGNKMLRVNKLPSNNNFHITSIKLYMYVCVCVLIKFIAILANILFHLTPVFSIFCPFLMTNNTGSQCCHPSFDS
jgi:hypothetical protein